MTRALYLLEERTRSPREGMSERKGEGVMECGKGEGGEHEMVNVGFVSKGVGRSQ